MTMYEVRAYTSMIDFDNRNASTIIDDITNKRDALREGRAWLMDHEVVKVQSDDRGFIQILQRAGKR